MYQQLKNEDDNMMHSTNVYFYRMMKENMTESSKEQIDSIPTDGFVKIYNSLDAESLKAPCRYVNFIKSYYNIVNRKKATLFKRQSMLSVRLV